MYAFNIYYFCRWMNLRERYYVDVKSISQPMYDPVITYLFTKTLTLTYLT